MQGDIRAAPVFMLQFELQSDANSSDPSATQYQVAWYFNGVAQTTKTFTVSSYSAGAIYLFSVQVGSAVAATGVYGWSATITITRSGAGNVVLTPSGYIPVVVEDASVYGAGWGISSIDQLYPITASGTVPAGLLWVTGSGNYRFFTGTGPYTNAEDFGTLVQSGSNYVYTDPQQDVETFNSSGFEISYDPPSGLDTSYTISGGKVTGVTAYDGGSTTINYDAHGILSSFSEPGSRTFTVSQTDTNVGGTWEGVLNSITDVDSTTRSFGYSGHQMTSDSWSPLYTSFTFSGTTGLLTGLTLGSGSTTIPYTIVSAASAGFASTSGTLTPLAGLPIPVPISATIEDGNSHTSTFYLDQRGRLLEYKDALSNVSISQLNSAGDTILSVDPLGRVSTMAYDSYGDVTETVAADGSFTINTYNSTFHELADSTNSLGETTVNTYNGTTGLIASSADPLGNTTTYVWSGGLLQSTEDPLGRITLARYDADDRRIAQIDSGGNWSLIAYNSYGFVDSTTNALGWTTLTTTNARGLATSTADPNGDVTFTAFYADGSGHTVTNAQGFTSTTTIDVRGLTTSQTDNLGNATTSGFDSAGNETSRTDPDGNTTDQAFDADNRQISTTDAQGNETQTQYDGDGNVTETIDAAGNVTDYYVNLQNQLVLTVDPLGYNQFTVFNPTSEALAAINQIGAATRTLYNADEQPVMTIDALGNTNETEYDADGETIQTTDGRGYSTEYLYTATGAQAAVIDANGDVTRTVTNALGEAVQTIDGNGHSSYFGFDFAGRENSTTDADSDTSEIVFSVTGATLESIDANGNVTVNTLDGDGRAVSSKDPDGNVTQQTFDPAGLVISSTDGNGKVTTYGYNKDGQQTSSLDPNGDASTAMYNDLGEEVASYDGSGNGTYSGLNADGEATGSAAQTGASTVQVFYATGQMSRLTDPDGNTTIFLADADGNSVGQIDPLGHMSFVSFNQDNQQTLTVDADGRSIEYTYDPAGRETAEVWLNAAGVQQNSVSFAYDDANNMTSAANNYGSYGFTLDSANRITAETTPFSLTVGLSYDGNGNVTSMTFAGATETSVYNGDNLLTSRRLSGGPSSAQLRFDITHTADNQIATISRYADTGGSTFLGETQETYDSAGNLTEIKHTNSSSTVLEDFQYTWTVANVLNSETDTISGTPTTTNYGYDTSTQLTSAGAASYSYDPNGNRTMSGYGVGPANQITTDGTWDYKFDPAGNLEKDGISNGLTWKLQYDNKNQLMVAAEYSGGSLQYQISYYYDPFGNLVEQDETQSGTTTATKFLNDQNGNAIADLNSSNTVEYMRVFLNLPDSVIARIYSDGTEYWYLADHLGSVRGLMGSSGSLADAITTSAFGSITTESAPSLGDRYKFADGAFNSVTGFSQFGPREYSAAIGRWTSTDPLGFAAHDSNLYRYVQNQPTTLIDPSGKQPNPQNMSRAEWLRAMRQLMARLEQAMQAERDPAVRSQLGRMIRELDNLITREIEGGNPALIVDNSPNIIIASIFVPWLMAARAGAGVGSGTFDPFVGTGGNAGFGRLIGWGTGAQQAAARAATITLQEIQAAGITRQVALFWLNFYRMAAASGRGGATAAARIALMERILQLLGG